MNDWPCVEPAISFSERGTQNCSTELLRPAGESTQMCWRGKSLSETAAALFLKEV